MSTATKYQETAMEYYHETYGRNSHRPVRVIYRRTDEGWLAEVDADTLGGNCGSGQSQAQALGDLARNLQYAAYHPTS